LLLTLYAVFWKLFFNKQVIDIINKVIHSLTWI